MPNRITILVLTIALFLPLPLMADDQCMLGAEIADRSMKLFETDREKGLAGMLQARQFCPDSPEIAYNLGLAYYRYRRPDLAARTWEGLAKKSPRDLTLATNLGWLYLELGQVDQAAAWSRKAMELGPGDVNAVNLSVEVLFRRGQYMEALDAAVRTRGVTAANRTKAREYATESLWRKFREGHRDQAVRDMMQLAGQYPSEAGFAQAKDKMILAIMGSSSDIPLPKPLPDQATATAAITAAPAPESEELNLAALSPTLKPSDKAYALVVGISRYRHINGPQFAEHDARQMQRMLTNLAGFRNDTRHMRLRLNHEATIGNLYSDIAWLVRRAKLEPDAKIVFYFSGHGSPVMAADQQTIADGILIPFEAVLDNLNDRTAIPLAYLNEQFSALPNENVLAVIDACFSGAGKSATHLRLARPRVEKSLLTRDKLFISASAADRPAEEYTPGRQGAFTYFFLEGLMGKADANKDGWVDTLEAFNYAAARLNALGLEQNPQISRPVRMQLTRY